MIFSYNWLQSFFNKKLPKPEKLAEVLTMQTFEVESVERKNKDWILDIAVTPNRGSDCFSHLGIAREIAAILNYKIKTPSLAKSSGGKQSFIKIEVKDKKDCPRYTAKIITDIKVGASPKYIRDRLEVCGLQPINNVVDIANYVMLELGQPLHAFDLNKLEGGKIIVRKAKKNEKIITLDNQKFELDKDILVIADAKNPIAIAGIKGGKKPEIDKKTESIFVESANFNYSVIRQASRRLNLKTDASWRFEHSIDPNLTEIAINRAAYLIQEIAKGKTASGLVDVYSQKVLPKKIKLDLNYVEKLLGIKISGKEAIKILESLDLKIKNNKSNILDVEIPTFRRDLYIPEDLIEEIGRIYGYEKIKPALPTSILITSKKNEDIFWQNIVKDILKELSFTEAYNYSFISQKDKENFSLHDLIELENPMNEDQKYLRPNLIINLIKNIKKNKKNYSQIKVFEMGKIYQPGLEKTALGGVIFQRESKELFYEIKGIVDTLLNKLGISDISYQPSRHILLHPVKNAQIKANREIIGFLGETNEDKNICVFEIDFETLQKVSSEEQEYRPISVFPNAVRDLAVLVSRKTKVVDVLNIINAAGGDIVRDVDLFDIYEGGELPDGKKNFAFHIIYQSENHTLSSKEIENIHKKIINALEKNPEWQVRK